MPRKPTLALLAVFVVAPLPIPASAWAASSDDAPAPALKHPMPERAPAWGRPTEAVRSAFAEFHDACAAWPKDPPLAPEPPAPMPTEVDQPYVAGCQLALDPYNFGQMSLLEGGALGAAAAGIAALVFKVAKVLLFGLADVVGRGVNTLWVRRRRANGWVD